MIFFCKCFSVCDLCSQARQAELEAARLVKEKEEEEAKQAALQAKKEKDIQKKAIKKERQKLRTTCKVNTLLRFTKTFTDLHFIFIYLVWTHDKKKTQSLTCPDFIY